MLLLQKNSSNSFRVRIVFFLSYLFGIETINTFIHSVVPSKTIPDSRPKWAKCIPVFRPKRHKNPTRWGGTHLCSLYKGVPPPPAFIKHFVGNNLIKWQLVYQFIVPYHKLCTRIDKLLRNKIGEYEKDRNYIVQSPFPLIFFIFDFPFHFHHVDATSGQQNF